MQCFIPEYGEEDPRTAMAMHNYAIALTMIGDHKEANEMAQRTYNAMKEVHGSEGSETLQAQYHLSRTEWNLKRKRKALATATSCQTIMLTKGTSLFLCFFITNQRVPDVKSLENARLACDLVCLLLDISRSHSIQLLLAFIADVVKEAKPESLRQIQQMCEKLMETFVQTGLLNKAIDVATMLEGYLRRTRSSDNLPLALCLRKRATLLLTSSNVQSTTLLALRCVTMLRMHQMLHLA